jgi:hypothetical protein
MPHGWPPTVRVSLPSYLPGLPLLVSPGLQSTATIAAGRAALALSQPISQAFAVDGLFDPGPLRQLLSDSVNLAKIASSGVQLRLGVVGVETAQLRFVTESAQLVRLGAGPATRDCAQLQQEMASARVELNRLNDDIRDFVFTDPEPDPEYQKLIRDRNSCSRKNQQLLRDQEPAGCPVNARVDPIQGAIASGAMPGFFPPVALSGELYVEGGISSLLPIQAAIELNPPFMSHWYAPGHIIGWDHALVHQWISILAAITGLAPNIPTDFARFDDGARAIAISDTIRTSSERRAWSSVPQHSQVAEKDIRLALSKTPQVAHD